jgi:hypothetical protein
MAAVERTDRIREAKVFLASRITEEAERQGAPLSETERKMLYFSPTGWTLEDMATVKEAFAREYHPRQFERRIARLIRSLRARLKANRDQTEYDTWSDAIRLLKEVREEHGEEHYLLALIADAPPEGEVSRLVITALVVIGVMLLALYLVSQGY